jgi:hypothetical protein
VLPQNSSAGAASGPALHTYDDVGGVGASTSVACGPKTSAKVCLAALAFVLPQAYGGGRLDASQRRSIDARLASLLGVAPP